MEWRIFPAAASRVTSSSGRSASRDPPPSQETHVQATLFHTDHKGGIAHDGGVGGDFAEDRGVVAGGNGFLAQFAQAGLEREASWDP